METRANFAIVGLFTLAVLAAGFGFVWWFSGNAGRSERQAVRLIFTGSVTGLTRGSNVLFNGFRVGEVSAVQLFPDDPKSIFVTIEIDEGTPVREDTRARIEAQGLAGVVAVQLIGGRADAPALSAKAGQPLPTIFAERSEVQDLIETVRNVARRTDELFERAGRLIESNDRAIANTVRNVERFSQALGDNADNINRTLASITTAAEQLGPLGAQLESFSRDIAAIARQLDVERLNRTLANIDTFTGALAGSSGDVTRTLSEASSLVARLNQSAGDIAPLVSQLSAFSRDAAALVGQVDGSRIARSLDNFDRFTQALASGSGNVESTLRDAAALTAKLNRSADQVDEVLAAARGFLGTASGPGGQNVIAEIGSAARSIRALADNLDRRTAEITTGISRFTGPGLREIEALAGDSRRTLTDINRTLRNLERNPQQLIFGNRPAIPDYGGRR